MRQFVLPAEWEGGPTCRIEGGRARYLRRVLRLGPGDRFPGLDARGNRRLITVLTIAEGELLLGVGPPDEGLEGLEQLPDARAGKPRLDPVPGALPEGRIPDGAPPVEGPHPQRGALPEIILAPALLKGEKMDLVVRQAAEAGVSRIQPLLTRRSLGKAEDPAARLERWERIAREALQQSGSAIPTRIAAPLPLAELPRHLEPRSPSRLGLILHEAPLAESSLHEYLTGAPEELVLVIGPEGGLATEELELLGAAGFRPVRLPGAVLRAETAALYAVAAVEIILSERHAWMERPRSDE